MKRLFSRSIFVILTLFVLSTAVFPSYAISTDKAKEAVNTARSCSMQLTYSADGEVFAGETVNLYKVAELSSDFKYTVRGALAKYSVDMNNVTAQSEWSGITAAVASYIIADNIKPDKTDVTDNDGKVSFSGLSCGMYFVSAVRIQRENVIYSFEAFLISVPSLNENGTWNYDVSAFPKVTVNEPTLQELSYKIVKAWKDTGNTAKRPKNIEIEIYKNGAFYKKHILNADNNWSCSWKAVDDGSVWTVAERNVPKGYTVSITEPNNIFSESEKVFSVINIYRGDIPESGDGTDIMRYVILMCVSGIVLIAVGIIMRKKKAI